MQRRKEETSAQAVPSSTVGETKKSDERVVKNDVQGGAPTVPGTPVRLSGLKNSWYLNGCVGRVLVEAENVPGKVGVLLCTMAGWREIRVALGCAETICEEEALDAPGAEKLVEETFKRNEAEVAIQSASCKRPG